MGTVVRSRHSPSVRLISVGFVQNKVGETSSSPTCVLKHAITAVDFFSFREIFWNHKASNRKYKGLAKLF